MQTTVTLPILDDSGLRILGWETLEVARRPGNYVRLLYTPAYVAGIARGDTIRLDPGMLRGFHMVEPGGIVGAAMAFPSVTQRRRAKSAVARAAREIGAVVDGEDGLLLILSLPEDLGALRIRMFLNELCGRFGAQWYLLNPQGPDFPTAVAARVGVRRSLRPALR